MDLPSLVYRKLIASEGPLNGVWKSLRRRLIRSKNDPSCTIHIHGRDMQMPLSHELPLYLKRFPCYDRLPGRVGAYMAAKHGRVICVDVGANIGDTLAAFSTTDDDEFLAIEPNPAFRTYLEANWAANPKVTILDLLCSSHASETTVTISQKSGTASFLDSSTGGTVRNAMPLDEILVAHPQFQSLNILKVDTDGHDFAIIAGARESLKRQRPALLFECDVFGNTSFLADCLATFARLQDAGYSEILVYDNFGWLAGRFALTDTAGLQNMIFHLDYHCESYADILVVSDDDMDAFYASEVEHFISLMTDPTRQIAMRELLTAAST